MLLHSCNINMNRSVRVSILGDSRVTFYNNNSTGSYWNSPGTSLLLADTDAWCCAVLWAWTEEKKCLKMIRSIWWFQRLWTSTFHHVTDSPAGPAGSVHSVQHGCMQYVQNWWRYPCRRFNTISSSFACTIEPNWIGIRIPHMLG